MLHLPSALRPLQVTLQSNSSISRSGARGFTTGWSGHPNYLTKAANSEL
jgi:hypothetical protein